MPSSAYLQNGERQFDGVQFLAAGRPVRLRVRDADDPEATVGNLVLLVLTHDYDPIAEGSLELLNELAANHQKSIFYYLDLEQAAAHLRGDARVADVAGGNGDTDARIAVVFGDDDEERDED